MYDYGPSSNFQGFDFLASYVYLLCILFFFSSQNKRRRTGKKVRLRVYKLCIIFSYKKNRDIFISLCGQESSIIEQCLATKCKVHRNPLVFS